MQRAQLNQEPSENPFKGRPIASYHDIVAMIRQVNSSARARPGNSDSRFYSTLRPELSDLETCDSETCASETCASDSMPADQSRSQSNEVQATVALSTEQQSEPDQWHPARPVESELSDCSDAVDVTALTPGPSHSAPLVPVRRSTVAGARASLTPCARQLEIRSQKSGQHLRHTRPAH